MKKLISILAAAAIGFAGAYLIVSNLKDSAFKEERARLEAEWQEKVRALEAELGRAARKPQRVDTQIKEVNVPVAARRSAAEILKNLVQIKPSGEGRIKAIRKIVHELEDLAQLKGESLPAIREFLARNEDLDYSTERTNRDEGDRGRWTPPWQRTGPSTEFTLPPSLRIGLFDVLKEIGSSDAEQILGEVLGTSGRAVEVAYLTRLLEEMAPGKYREIAINAAKDLLRNPLAIDNPNRLDEQAEAYLYGILELYKDVSFSEEAKRLLVSEGRLNRNAQDYLAKTQGENVVATFYDAYKNTTLSNMWDRASVANQILDHVGPNQQANNFLNEIVTNTNLDARMRSFAVLRLAGGFGGMESPTDPNVIRSRMQVIETLKPAVTDERLTRAVDMTQRNLNNLLEGRPIEPAWGEGRGDRGPRRDQPAN
jgi:hypothetical protein